jgi:hypothetical protein
MIERKGVASRTWPAPPNTHRAPMPGPAGLLFERALLPEMCARIRARRWPPGERQWLDPDADPDVAAAVGELIARAEQHYQAGVQRVDGVEILRYQAGDSMRRHHDNEYEGAVLPELGRPVRRVPFAANIYLSPPGDYVGGALVVAGPPPQRAALGAAVVVRGDVMHAVAEVTAGERVVLKALVSVPTRLRWVWRDGQWVRQ